MKRCKTHRKKTSAMSLIEVMIAMSVVAMVAGGLLSGVMQTRSFTENNIYKTSAVNAVTSYVEQIKSMPYDEVLDSINDPFGTPLETAFDDTTPDPIFLSTWNDRNVIINVDSEGNTIESMEFSVWPYLRDISTSGTGLRAQEIILFYRWKSPVNFNWELGSLKYVRSSIETY